MLILYWDLLWDEPLRIDNPLPPDCEITTNRSLYARADAVVFHIPNWKWRPRFLLPKKRREQVWVALCMESEVNYPQLLDPRWMSRFELKMTYRLDSDVPLPYLSFYETTTAMAHALRVPPQPKQTRHAPCVSFISSGFNKSHRQAYMRELMRYIQVDSYGKFMRNARLPEDRGRSSKLECIAGYKFTLAFENSIARDYVTEKFYDPLVAGSVPVYLGAPNIDEFAPGEQCFINTAEFETPRALAEYLQHLANDDAYAAYHTWRAKPFTPLFQTHLERFSSESHHRLYAALVAYQAIRRERAGFHGLPG